MRNINEVSRRYRGRYLVSWRLRIANLPRNQLLRWHLLLRIIARASLLETVLLRLRRPGDRVAELSAGIIHGPTLARSASEGSKTTYPRLRFGLVLCTLRRSTRAVNNPG